MHITIQISDGPDDRSNKVATSEDSVLTSENEAIWREYLTKKIWDLITPEAMETPEYKAAEEKIQKKREEQERFVRQMQRMRQHTETRRSLSRPKINYIPQGLTIDLEKEYAYYLDQEVSFIPKDSSDFAYLLRLMNRWQEKSIPQILQLGRPDAAYAIAIEVCRHLPLLIHRDDIQTYIQKNKVRIRKMIIASFKALASTVQAWNHEEKRQYVANFIHEQSRQYTEFRGLAQDLLQLIPSEPFTGYPVRVKREMNRDELYQVQQAQRLRAQEELNRQKQEREARSLIPLNPMYETHIFCPRNIGWELTYIDHLMSAESKRIKQILEKKDYMTAVTLFLQLTKSMCQHFVKDEHYNYFDDMYDPEYTIQFLFEYIKSILSQNQLPKDVKVYLLNAWAEIKTYEACTDYGVLHHMDF